MATSFKEFYDAFAAATGNTSIEDAFQAFTDEQGDSTTSTDSNTATADASTDAAAPVDGTYDGQDWMEPETDADGNIIVGDQDATGTTGTDQQATDTDQWTDQTATEQATDQDTTGVTGEPPGDPNAWETTESILARLLGSDSPYLEAARTRAQEQMAARGLQNSSIALGAGERAAIESALPIAQQDSQQSFGWARAEQDFGHDFALAEQDFGHSMDLLTAEYDRRWDELERSIEGNLDLQELRNQGAMDLERLKQEFEAGNIEKSHVEAYLASYGATMSAMNAEIAAVQQAEGMSAEQKQQALQDIYNRYGAYFETTHAMYTEYAEMYDWDMLPDLAGSVEPIESYYTDKEWWPDDEGPMVSSTTENPDGSTTTTNTDGSSTTTHPDGSTTTTDADGNTITTNPDGSTTSVDSLGNTTTTYPDGSKVVTKPDGSYTEYAADGTKTRYDADGNEIEGSLFGQWFNDDDDDEDSTNNYNWWDMWGDSDSGGNDSSGVW